MRTRTERAHTLHKIGGHGGQALLPDDNTRKGIGGGGEDYKRIKTLLSFDMRRAGKRARALSGMRKEAIRREKEVQRDLRPAGCSVQMKLWTLF